MPSSVPPFNFKSSTESCQKSELNHTSSVVPSFKSMPDITNNTMSKSLSSNKLKGGDFLILINFAFAYEIISGSGSNSGLPDVTASTGFGGFLPAKELKTGSVMDILG